MGGATRGMRVEWRIRRLDSGASAVAIRHRFRPSWPLVPDRVVQLVVGELFVSAIARRTLRCVKAAAERPPQTRTPT